MMRVVSLLPGATEIVGALGALDRLVGVSHACDHPPAVARLPRVTSSRVSDGRSPGAVDAQVRALAAAGAPLFTVHEDVVAALRPDVLLTQALCDVCAVSEEDVRALAGRLRPAPVVVTLGGTTLSGVYDDVARVAGALGVADEGEELIAGLRARVRRVHERLKVARAPRPRVAVIEWTDPLFAAGHWVPELVARAGGVDVLAEAGRHSVPATLERVVEADPEVVVLAPCGYDATRAEAEGRALLAADGWRWARRRAVWALDANALTSRPGPRLVDAIETLAGLMHPSLFPVPDHARARRLAPESPAA